jgi:hypothetical protein
MWRRGVHEPADAALLVHVAELVDLAPFNRAAQPVEPKQRWEDASVIGLSTEQAHCNPGG